MSKLTEREAVALLDEAREHVLLHSNSKTRMDMVLDYCPWLKPYGLGERILRYEHWLRLLGENWTGCDIVTPYAQTLKPVMGVDGPLRPMMDAPENAAYDALPDTVTVYRGSDAERPSGVCWSIDEQVANSFPFLRRFRAKTPVVIRARARKERILAVKLDREEMEIITFSPRRLGIKRANEIAAEAVFDARHAAHMVEIEPSMKRHTKLLIPSGTEVGAMTF